MMATSTASAEEQSKKRTREDDEATDESTKRSKNADGDAGPASKSASKPTKDGEATINDDEAALYDRQIRLWGLDGQTRMRNTKILIVGMKSLSNEVVKNTVLAGVGGITILDPEQVDPKDLGAQFFLRESDIGSNRAQAVAERVNALNPRVKIEVVTEPVDKQPESFFDGFTVVCATGLDLDTLQKINAICRRKGIKFYAAELFGFYGYYFCDLVEHSYTVENKEMAYGEEIVTKETISEPYSTLQDAFGATFEGLADSKERKFGKLRFTASPLFFAIMTVLKFRQKAAHYPTASDTNQLLELKQSYLKSVSVPDAYVPDDLVKSIAAGAGTEISPVAAIVGGQLGQDILKVVSGKDAPINNIFCLNGDTMNGHQHRLPPAKEKKAVVVETIDLDDD